MHDMKRIRKQSTAKKPRKTYSNEYVQPKDRNSYSAPRSKVRKKRKGLMRHIIEEAFDVIEDIFD